MSAKSVSRGGVDEIVAADPVGDASDGDGEDKEEMRGKGTRESENQNFVSARDSESAQTRSVQTKDTQASSRNNPSRKKQTVDQEMQTVDKSICGTTSTCLGAWQWLCRRSWRWSWKGQARQHGEARLHRA